MNQTSGPTEGLVTSGGKEPSLYFPESRFQEPVALDRDFSRLLLPRRVPPSIPAPAGAAACLTHLLAFDGQEQEGAHQEEHIAGEAE